MTSDIMVLPNAAPYPAPGLTTPAPFMPDAHIGSLLREWRAARRVSQLDLALDAGLSARHLSCVETGKAQPSRETIARLADALDMPLRERNALLVAAGYAPKYPETGLATPGLAQVRRAIECILEQQEPYPAFLLNRHWDVLMANRAAMRVNHFVMRGQANKHANMIRQVFDPADLRPAVANWEEVAGELIRHLHNLVASAPTDTVARALPCVAARASSSTSDPRAPGATARSARARAVLRAARVGAAAGFGRLDLAVGDEARDDVLDVLVEAHVAGGDLAQRRHGGLVVAGDARRGAVGQLSRALGGEHDEREPVGHLLETIFYGDAGH